MRSASLITTNFSRFLKRFTLIEMLVVISIIAILAALLMPSLQSAINTAKKLNCTSNMKQINLMFDQYSTDYNGYYPPLWQNNGSPRWPCYELVGQYAEDPLTKVGPLFYCPSLEEPSVGKADKTGIGYNQTIGKYTSKVTGKLIGAKQTQFATPSKTLLLIDSSFSAVFDSLDPNRPWGQGPRYGHNQFCNAIFVDGHTDASEDYRIEEQAKWVNRKVR